MKKKIRQLCLFVLILIPMVTAAIQITRLTALWEDVRTSEPLAIEFDVPGIVSPHLFAGDRNRMTDDAVIIGVVQSGEARAYLLSAFFFRGTPSVHIVNDVFGAIPITVTHCDQKECTRVFTSDQVPGEPLDVRAGGMTLHHQLALLIDGRRYSQGSEKIPLQEVDFVQTTWKEWRQEHPQSKIYLGDVPPAG
ncbi:MAG: DUF3179 domain-containing protein [Pirellulaceae bacterium]|nr:DUF3179 domain-containing protein [Pirellulaceae bacterium]